MTFKSGQFVFSSKFEPYIMEELQRARLIETVILFNVGIKYVPVMLSNYYYSNIDQYYIAFSKTIKAKNHSVGHFLKFVIDGFTKSTADVSSSVKDLIRTRLLQQQYEVNLKAKLINQRLFDLLNYMLTQGDKITLKDLSTKVLYRYIYQAVSERTARRDLDKLTEKGFLKIEGDSQYIVNRHFID